MEWIKWTGSDDCNILVFALVDYHNMKNLVLVDKYCARECSTEHFYRRRIIIYFGVDLHGYVNTQKGDSYKKTYRSISPTLYNEKRYSNLENGKSYGNLIPKNFSWYTFLESCKLGYLPMVKKMLDSKEIVMAGDICLGYQDKFGNVVDAQQWQVLELLFDYGLDIKIVEWEIMWYVGASGDVEEAKKWSARGINLKDGRCAALRAAVREGHDDLVVFLLESGVPPNYEEYVDDWAILMWAPLKCKLKTVKALVEHGATLCNQEILWLNLSLTGGRILDPEMKVYLEEVGLL